MAKLSSIKKNQKRIRLSNNAAEKRKALKVIIMNKNLSLEERFEAQMKISSMSRDTSKTRVRNRCELTGRPRGVYRKFKLARNVLRNLAAQGFLPGVRKSSL